MYVFRDPTGTQVLFAQQRVFDSEGGKNDLPWTRWSDGQWRNCESVDGLLPLYGLDHLSKLSIPTLSLDHNGSVVAHRYCHGLVAEAVMIHEGAKTADFIRRMLFDASPAATSGGRSTRGPRTSVNTRTSAGPAARTTRTGSTGSRSGGSRRRSRSSSSRTVTSRARRRSARSRAT